MSSLEDVCRICISGDNCTVDKKDLIACEYFRPTLCQPADAGTDRDQSPDAGKKVERSEVETLRAEIIKRDRRISELLGGVDYQALLLKYIRYIGDVEGANYINPHDNRYLSDQEFTAEEWAELNRLDQIVSES